MPVDFQTYFLSSSPPGFDLDSYASENFLKRNGLGYGFQNVNSIVAGKDFYDRQEQPSSILGNVEIKSVANAERVLCWNQSYENFSKLSEDNSSPVSGTEPTAKTGRKKVSFADDIGLALEDVRVMEEESDVPPILQTDLIVARLNLGSTSLLVENSYYVLNFPQPSSDYLVLRNKIESNKVSLESATARSSSIMGTVRVKNIAYEKRVFVRLTYNNWETCTDILASYVSSSGGLTPASYDTFEFEISLSTDEKHVSKIYFAVCYEAGNEQFWDNNNGENYEIISIVNEAGSDGLNGSNNKVFSLSPDKSWTDFSSWDGIGSCDPYW